MPDFAYTARDSRGEKVSGVIAAGSEREAVAVLSGKALFPLSVQTAKPATALASTTSLFTRRVSGQTMAVTYSQLAGLLRSGVPLLRSLKVIKEQSSHPRLTEVLGDVYERVEDGSTLAEAMARNPQVFSEMAINMVRAGGEGGFLEDALQRVSQFTEQQEDLKSRTIGALAYPVFLGTVGSIIVTVLIIFFVPRFEPMFKTLREKGELPAITDWLLGFSNFLNQWWWLAALLIGMGVVYVRGLLATKEGRRWSDRVKLRLPMIGAIFKSLAVARFCRVLGTLLKNGVPILKSLEISREATGNKILAEAIEKASENISAGQSLAQPLSASGHFPRTVVEMVAVAEESNSLDTVLVEIADGLERRTERQLDLFVRLLEPVMLLLLAGVVLVVVLALLMPIMKMSTTI